MSAPECTKTGLRQRTCQRCGETEQETIAAKGHVPKTVSGTPATCTASGWTDYTVCSICDEVLEPGTEISALDHNFGEWQTLSEPECTKTGLRQRTCQRCGETEQETIAANGHTPITDPGSPATCTESGWTDHIYCDVCEEVLEPLQTEIPALGHDWGAFVTVKEPTCAKGLKRRTCQRAGCGATEEEEIDAISPHVAGDMTTENEKEATCTTPYSWDEVTYCSVCGGVMSTQPRETGSPLGHYYDWEGGVEYVKDPTCTEDGEVKYTCQRCGATVTETIPAGHTPGDPTDKAPTCIESGYSGRVFCTECGTVLEAGTEVPSTGTEHNYELHDTDNKPVLIDEENGIYQQMLCFIYRCEYCGDEYWEPYVEDDPPSGYPGY